MSLKPRNCRHSGECREERDGHTQHYVRRRFSVFSAIKQSNSLETERGKRSEPAAEAGYQGSSHLWMCLRVHVVLREYADEKASTHIYNQCADWKRRSRNSLGGSSQHIARYTSCGASERDPEKHRGKLMSQGCQRGGPLLATVSGHARVP